MKSNLYYELEDVIKLTIDCSKSRICEQQSRVINIAKFFMIVDFEKALLS